MRVMLDTNVLIDLIERRIPFADDIKKLLIAAEFGDVELHACAQSYADAYYVLCAHAAKDDVKRALLATTEYVEVCSTFGNNVKGSLMSDWKDIEVYLIAYAAKQIKADCLISRDKEVLKKSPVNALTSADFLAMLKQDYGLDYDSIELD